VRFFFAVKHLRFGAPAGRRFGRIGRRPVEDEAEFWRNLGRAVRPLSRIRGVDQHVGRDVHQGRANDGGARGCGATGEGKNGSACPRPARRQCSGRRQVKGMSFGTGDRGPQRFDGRSAQGGAFRWPERGARIGPMKPLAPAT